MKHRKSETKTARQEEDLKVPLWSTVKEMTNGWPLGLQAMSMRLRVLDSLQATAADPSSSCMHSVSFTSFTSSDLDTESTKSFFQDRSVSLGRLIGLRPDSLHLAEHEQIFAAGATTNMTNKRQMETSEWICIPLLLSIFCKDKP
ncbi:hypothetical protein NE237_002345 [Protea cynaroides]|uniref:Uncharacterized protein n=1 Tax=Protea cynaroides TaxID=273540 RepID=A0A9Q0KV99_9MAGN|nr:hypothetical protein NE237_002345 [Protea cynaroides]